MKPSQKSIDQVSMLSRAVRLGLGWILMAALAGAAQAGIILTYQDGLNGYTGTDDSAIIGLHPRGDGEMVAISGQTAMGVKYQNQPGELPAGQFSQDRTVIKFTGLNLASYGLSDVSQIVSVKMRLNTTVFETEGTTVSVYGLLKNFREGTVGNTTGAEWTFDGVTWRYANYNAGNPGTYPTLAWTTLGADATGTAYDSSADRRATADDTVNLNFLSGGSHNLWAEWDVTASFLDQYLNGKEYGWVMSGPGMAPGGAFYNIAFASSEALTQSLRPMLVVETTLVPEPSVAALLLVAGAVIWRRRRKQ